VWNFLAPFFHSVELLGLIFPQCGKNFSTVWNFCCRFFHGVENHRTQQKKRVQISGKNRRTSSPGLTEAGHRKTSEL